jgi:hypothetical protein
MTTTTWIDELTTRAGTVTFEPRSGGKPVCVADALYRMYEER